MAKKKKKKKKKLTKLEILRQRMYSFDTKTKEQIKADQNWEHLRDKNTGCRGGKKHG